jgi:hypothetical protein
MLNINVVYARKLWQSITCLSLPKELGVGGQRRTERELGWSRVTIRKGRQELESGCRCLDAFAARGRKRAAEHLPSLLTDSKALVDSQSQTDPQLRTARLSTRLSAAEVRRQLIVQKGYTDATLPTVQTLTTQRNALGYSPKKGAKSQPPKNARNGRHLRADNPDQSGG